MPGSFADPADTTGIDFAGLHGCLLMLNVKGYEDHIPTVHTKPGEKSPAIRADVTVLDGNQAGTTVEDSLIFPRMLVGQLRPRLGMLVLGRLVQGPSTGAGKNPPWRLDPASEADRALGESYLNRSRISQPAPPPQNGYGGPATGQGQPHYGGQTAADPWASQQVPQSAPPF